MNIVFVINSYYPEMSAPAACMDKYIQILKFEHSIDIINPLNRIDPAPLNDDLIRVHEVYSWLWKCRIYCEEKIRNKEHVGFYSFLMKAFKFKSFITSPFYYPSSMKWQLNKFSKVLEKIYLEKSIDVVISVSDPICCALSVLKFKKRHPEVKWINCFMDPFTFQPSKYRYVIFKNLRREKNYRNEVEIYNTADFNLFTEELYKMALSKFNQKPEKTYLMKYILNEIPSSTVSTIHEAVDKIRMVYAGTFLKDKRNPKYCLSVLSQMPEVELDMYIHFSNCDDVISQYLSKSIRRLSSVDRKRYCEIITNEYDILLNLGNNFSLQIPSKFYELISTGRPIVNFYQLKDSQYDMIERYPLGLNVGLNEADADIKILTFCKKMIGKRLSFKEVEQLFPEHSLETQYTIIKKLIES